LPDGADVTHCQVPDDDVAVEELLAVVDGWPGPVDVLVGTVELEGGGGGSLGEAVALLDEPPPAGAVLVGAVLVGAVLVGAVLVGVPVGLLE
jgi:hypothetical protein